LDQIVIVKSFRIYKVNILHYKKSFRDHGDAALI